MTKILVIEDEPTILENILEILKLENFEGLAAEDGTQGIELARQQLPDLIVCDIMMPGLTGYDVLTQLRDDSATVAIPFIFLTARGDKTSIRYGMGLGADDYITKPFTAAELLTAISSRLEKRALLDQDHQQEMAELRGNILHMLPHELRTPLNGVLGFSQMLMKDAGEMESAEIAEVAERIYNSGKGLLKVIERFLAYAQVEAIKHDPEWLAQNAQRTTASPELFVEEAAVGQASQAQREDDLRLDLVESPPIRIMSGFFRMMVPELIGNAFKFSRPGTLVIVTTRCEDNRFVLTVQDQGRGMTAQEIDQVGMYMQFQRKRYEQQGVGLGLAIVKGLTEVYQGDLTFESVPDEYLTVTLSLPIAED